MISMNLTQSQAFKLVNSHLSTSGQSVVSQTNFYRLRAIYMRRYPKSKWVAGDRLIYAPPVVLYLYFLCRVHGITQNLRITELWSNEVVAKLPGRFSECFRSFSDVDSFFLNQANSAA